LAFYACRIGFEKDGIHSIYNFRRLLQGKNLYIVTGKS